MRAPGHLGPALAVLLAMAVGMMTWHALSVDLLHQTALESVELPARDNQSPSPGIEMIVLKISQPDAARPYLRRYTLKGGRHLDPSNGRDHTLMMLARIAERTGEIATRVSKRAIWSARADGDTVWVFAGVAPQKPPFKLAGMLVAAAGLFGFAFWVLLARVREARWVAFLGASVTGGALVGALGTSLWLTAQRATALWPIRDHSALDKISGLPTIVAAFSVPLVIAAVHGWVTSSRRSPHRTAYAYIAPAMIGMGALILVPFVLGLGLAFMRQNAGVYTFVGFDNFVQILTNDQYGLSHPLNFYFTLGVTLLWTSLNVILHVGIGLGLALILQEPTLRFKGVYRILLIVPWAVPNYITALVWKGMFNTQYGLINYVLSAVGIEPVSWFSEFWTAFAANVTTNTWLGFPFMMVVALGALQSIPRELYEAASVDGASKWQQFKSITLPLLKPALFPAIILGSIWTFNMFNIIYLVSGGQPNHSTDILIVEAYRWAFEQDRYGYAAAYSTLIFVILLGYSLITSRITKAAEEAYG